MLARRGVVVHATGIAAMEFNLIGRAGSERRVSTTLRHKCTEFIEF
jgi:hypothetical protein